MIYPIIFNGDHAEFEMEHGNTPPKERPDWPLPSMDAMDWAEAFCKVANKFGYVDKDGQPIPEDWMVGWFANALMRGYDERASERPQTEKVRWGFKSKTQLPLFMIWREYRCGDEVEGASVIFSTSQWWLYWPFHCIKRAAR